MPLFRPRFVTFFTLMHQRIRERPDWIRRIAILSTIAFAVLVLLYLRDRQGLRF
ncbi:MAG: hypothetical protein AB1342_08185 [Pseudomonadota bacterium]